MNLSYLLFRRFKGISFFLPILIFAVMVVFLIRGLFLEPKRIPCVQLGKSLPTFSLPRISNKEEASALEHKETKFFSNTELKGHLSLIHIWSSWCIVCQEEQAFLAKLAEKFPYLYGISYKDTERDARDWLAHYGNPYQAVGLDQFGILSIDLGVSGTPETFLVDEGGIIRFKHTGLLTETVWQNKFIPLMKQLSRKRQML